MFDSSASQNDGWNSNAYLAITIRVLVGFGILFLIRSLVQLVQYTRGRLNASHHPTTTNAHSQPLGFDVELDAVQGLFNGIDPSLDLEAGLGIGVPRPVYSPGRRDRQ